MLRVVAPHEEGAVELRVVVVARGRRGAGVRRRGGRGGDHGAGGAVRRGHVGGAEGAVLFVGALEDGGGFVGEVDAPLAREHADDAERAPGAEPVLGNLFEVLDAVDDVALGRLFGEVEHVDGHGRVDHVDGDVADLPQVVRLFVEAHELGDGARIGGADAAGGHVGGER